MPPASGRMTQQPVRPARYFPGRAYGPETVDDDDDDTSDSDNDDSDKRTARQAPKASSFPAQPKPVTENRSVGYALPISARPPEPDLEGFVTASESSDAGGDEGGSAEEGSESEDDEGEDDDDDEEDEESSDDEPKRPMLAPKFISKAKRVQQTTPSTEMQDVAEKERERKAKADEMLQLQLERDAAARAAGKRYWDDEDVVDEVDDTDGLDVPAETAAWKLRELKRVQRDRATLVEKEKEREEVERRRNLTTAEREAEDAEYLAQQAEAKDDKGKMAFMQRYHHKGAFFAGDEQDEEVKAALNRDFAGARFQDDTGDKSVLPEYMRIRDMAKLGRKGRSKYKDLKSEDTGRWGDLSNRRKGYDDLDDRFRPDDHGRGAEKTGANTAPLGERRKADDEISRTEKRARYG